MLIKEKISLYRYFNVITRPQFSPSSDAMHYWPIQNRRVFGGALPGRPGIVMAMAPSPAFALRKGSFAPIAQKAPVVVRKTFPEAWLWEDIVEDR